METRAIVKSFFLCFFSLATSFADADSPVWKVSKGEHYFYLGGTIHLLDKNDHPLPTEFEKAYQDAQILVFETDIRATSSLDFQTKMMKAFTFQDGSTLPSSIKKETYENLRNFAKKRELPLQNFVGFTPAGLSLMLAVMEYQRIGLKPEFGVDSTFNEKAVRDKKNIVALETPEAQLAFISSMNTADPDDVINHTIRDLNKLSTLFDKLKKAWREGDLKTLEKEGIAEMRQEFPKIYEALISTRNNNWITKMKTFTQNKQTEFVLVGTLHLAGKDGLIKRLEAEGFKTKQL